MKRVLCIRFPHWPLQRLRIARPELKDRPIFLYQDTAGRGARVAVCCETSVRQGVVPGMPLAEALALTERRRGDEETRGRGDAARKVHPPRRAGSSPSFPRTSASLASFPSDPAADRCALESLARWCRRYSPCVGLEEADEPASLLLDITGCAPLFGGEQKLAELVLSDLQGRGLSARIAVADTIGAAWALAHFRAPRRAGNDCGSNIAVVPPGEQPAALKTLPVEALRLSRRIVETLREFDLCTVGQLQKLPRTVLPARFGPVVAERIDQATGHLAEMVVPVRDAPPIEAVWSSDEPVSDRLALEAVFNRLIGKIVSSLEKRREGVLKLVCRLESPSSDPVRFDIGMGRPVLSERHLDELVRLQLERLAVRGDVAGVHLRAAVVAPLPVEQRDIFNARPARNVERELAVLLNRLSSRLGPQAVLRPRLVADAQPEYAWRRVEDVSARGQGGEAGTRRGNAERKAHSPRRVGSALRASSTPSRSLSFSPPFSLTIPLFLHPRPVPVEAMSIVPDGPPVRFDFSGCRHVVHRSWGPERIETGWWRSQMVRRDYYRVETEQGARFWLFRNLVDGDWFLHGIFE